MHFYCNKIATFYTQGFYRMATIQKRTRKTGKTTFTATIRIKGYKPLSATFDRATDAKTWIQENESKMRKGKHIKEIEARKHTVAELIDRYLEHEVEYRKSDKEKFKMHLAWWKENIGFYILSDITPAILAECRDKIQNEPSKKPKKKKKERSNSTVNRYMSTMSIVFTKAVKEWGWLEDNPMFRVSKRKEDKGRVRFLTDDERTKLLEACKKCPNPLMYLLVILALSTGARYSEIINLQWKNIDFKNKQLHFLDTKNGEDRGVPLSQLAYDLLKEHSKVRNIKSDFVFARSKGDQPLDIRCHWRKILKEIKLENFRFHDLRHSAASELAMSGASLLEIAEILGHKTLAMVQRYSHLTKKHTAELLERMNEKQFANIENT